MIKLLYIRILIFLKISGELCLSIIGTTSLFKKIFKFVALVFLLFITHSLYSQDPPYCEEPTPIIDVDLTDSPDAFWESVGATTPVGPCCGAPNNHNCIELIIELHPDASYIEIIYSTAAGNLTFTVNCEPLQSVPEENEIIVCFDDPGPHSMVFCRPGGAPYEFEITSYETVFFATLDPFDPVCITDDEFELTGGNPVGGTYFVNGVEHDTFDPAEHGPGIHTIEYVYLDEITGCAGSDSQTIEVMEIPEVILEDQELCDYGGLAVLIEGSPPGGYFTGDYIVDGEFFDLDAAPPGDHEVVYHYDDVCSGSDTAIVTVHEVPEATAEAVPEIIAEGETTNLEGSATGGSGDYSYHWEPEDLVVDPDEPETETEELFNTTIFTLTVTDNVTGCIATVEVEVVVTGTALTIIDIAATPDTICFGETSQLWVQPSGGSGVYSYEWSADDAGVVFDPNNTARDPVVDNLPVGTTEFTVLVTDSDGLTADSTVTVTVLELPVVTLNLPEDKVCANTPNYSLTGGEPPGGTYYLLDEDGSLLFLPDIDFSDFYPQDIGEGNYQVLYEYTDPVTGCTSFDIADFEILPYVEADFHVNQDLCQSNEIIILNLSVGEGLVYDWDFGDGGVGQVIEGNLDDASFTYEYEHHGGFFSDDYVITLTVSNIEGCSHTYQYVVTVYPKVEFEVNVDNPEGCSPLTVGFDNQTSGPVYYYIWEFGDGASSMETSPVKTYQNYGASDTTYVYTLTAVSYNFMCEFTYVDSVTVYPNVKAGFALDPVEACAPYDAAIMNNAINAEFYEWDFYGDASVTSGDDDDIIEHTYENPGPDILYLTLKQTVWLMRNGIEVCHDEYEKDVTIYPEVTAALTADVDDGCAPLIVEFQNNSVNETNVFWDFDDGSTSSQENPVHTFENTTGVTIEYEVMLVAWSEEACYDTTYIPITVHPQVTAGFDFSPANICQYQEVVFTNTSASGSGMTYAWDLGPDAILVDGDPLSDATFTYIFDHDEPLPQKYEIELIVNTTEGCVAVATDSITVYPKVIADFVPLPGAGCSALEVNFVNNSTGGLYYYWDFDDGDASSTEFEPVYTFVNPGYVDIEVFNVELVVESEYLCYDTLVAPVEVLPSPKALFTVEEAAGCSPFEVTINNLSEGVDTYNWDFGDGTPISFDDSPVIAYEYTNLTDDPVVHTIHLLAENADGCSSEYSIEITVYPEVTAGFDPVDDGCHPHTVLFPNTSHNAVLYEWDFGDGITSTQENPEHTYLNFSHTINEQFTATLYAESEFGCYDIFEQAAITVFPRPLSSFLVEDPVGCSPHEVIIHDASVGGSEFTLDMGDGTVYNEIDFGFGFSEAHEYTIAPGDDAEIYEIVFTVFNGDGCSDVFTQQVTVYPDIIAEFDFDVDEGCHPLVVSFTNESQGALGYAAYEWDFGDGNTSTDEHPVHTFNNYSHIDDITYTVTLTAYYEDACFDTFQHDITVFATPLADFSVLNSPGCAPHEIIVVNESIGADSYEWDFGDNSNPGQSFDEDPGPVEYTLVPGDDPGISTITLDVLHTNGCPHQFQLDVTIYPEIEAAVSANVDEGCAPLTIQFENSSSLNATSFHWNFGDGNISSKAEPEYTFHNTTGVTVEYDVEMVVESDFGCTDTTNIIITVHPQVNAGFVFSPAYVCNPHQVEFVNTSVSESSMTYDWAFGDGNTSIEENPSNVYDHNEETPQIYDIELTVTADVGGCVDVAMDQIIVYPKVFADFVPVPVVGCSPLEVFFQNDSERAENYQWHFGHGEASSTEDEPTHTFVNTGHENSVFFDVTLIAESEYLCYDTIVLPDAVEVFPVIKAAFTVEESSGCTPFTVTINNNSKGVDDYEWEFDDGTGIHNIDLDTFDWTFENNTDDIEYYTITLSAVNDEGCDSVYSRVITVYPAVNAGFSVDEDSGCNPHDVVFTNTTGDLVTFDIFYEWDFGDESTSTLESPGHTYLNLDHIDEAVFRASLFAQSEYGCWDLYEPDDKDVTVFPEPLASFWAENDDPCMPQVIIHNASIGSTEFILDLGDGTIIPGDDFSVFPYVHDYIVAPDMVVRVFDIELTVFNDDDCADVSTQQVTVYPDIIAGFDMSNDTGCHPFNVSFTNESVGASGYIEYEWDFGDGNISREENPQHTFQNHSQAVDETFTVTLTAYYEDACYDTFQREVTVQASPLADFTVPNSPGCAPHDIEVVNNSEGATVFAWDFGDGSVVDNSEHPDPHQYTQPAGAGPGIFTITLNVDNDNGCSHQYQQNVTIYPEIDAMFTMNGEGCHPLTVHFDNETVGGESFTWDFGEGNQTLEDNPQHVFYNYSYTDIVTRTVTLYAESDHGCLAEHSEEVEIFPLPKAAFALSEVSGCSPFTPEISNSSTGINLNYEWDFDNSISNEEEPVHSWLNTTTNPVNYQVFLTVFSEHGCSNSIYEKITVYPEVISDFTTIDGLFADCSPFTVKFVNESHLGNTYLWDFDDGNTSTSENPLHVFVNENTNIKNFNVSLEATSGYGCKDTLVRIMSAYPSPEADFSVSPKVQTYPETTFAFTNLTNPGDWTFEWDFGDGSDVYITDEYGSFDYTYVWEESDMTTKTYTISLTAFNDLCEDITEKLVTITSPLPVADFGPSTQGCAPFEVQFFNNSLYSNRYRWYFGDGVISVDENPRHVFFDHGDYDVMLIAFGDGGRDTTYRQVSVFENPVADFELVSNLVLIPHEPLQVINKSQLAGFYYWEFGDGGTSAEFEPVYYYDTPGIYDVSLTVFTDTDPQCVDNKTLESALRVDESCRIIFPNAFKPSTTGPSGGAYDPSDPVNEVFYPLHEGVDNYVLQIYNRWGELIFRSTDPNIGWDGYFRGRPAPMDVYIWKVTGRCTNGITINKSGDVTLIR